MALVVIALGSEQPVHIAVKEFKIDKLVLIPGKQPENPKEGTIDFVSIAKKLEHDYKEKGYNVICENPVDPFDFMECYRSFIRILKSEPNIKEKVIIMSNGTKIISASAVMAAVSQGAKAIYIQERPEEIMVLDIPNDTYYQKALKPAKKKILAIISRNGKSTSQLDIQTEMNLSPSTISTHMKQLYNAKLIDKIEMKVPAKTRMGEPDGRTRGGTNQRTGVGWCLTAKGDYYGDLAKNETLNLKKIKSEKTSD